jgi:hypothetical protein
MFVFGIIREKYWRITENPIPKGFIFVSEKTPFIIEKNSEMSSYSDVKLDK